MTFHIAKPRADDIADAVRKRICMQLQDGPHLLLEGALADEFGVSRTPVRQALQRLAYEGLIEVRTGVGSIVNPMDPAVRSMHFAVHGELLKLVARLPDEPIPPEVARRLGMMSTQDMSHLSADRDTVYALFKELNALISQLIPDPVIADAHIVSGWRIVRWFMADMQNGDAMSFEALLGLCRAHIHKAESGRAAMFRAASDIVLAAVA